MIFNSNVFLFAFLPAVLAAFWIARGKQQRYLILTLAGFVFYSYWNWSEQDFHLERFAAWKYTCLLLFSCVVSFCAGLLIDRTDSRARKRAVMMAALSVDLGLLAYFKYFNFLFATVNSVSGGTITGRFHDVVLPVGISFYTFHTMSYIIDVAAGRVRATRNLLEYFTYVSLFTQLVAGPIIRFRHLQADLENIDAPADFDGMATGLSTFLIGFVKKVVIADAIGHYIDPILVNYRALSMEGAWLCALGFAFQIYYDFSGYSDMAIGLGRLFGFRIPVNFNAPYRAEGFRDFWRRWHISLSSWLRDYLYIPLGGNREGKLQTDMNVLLTMLLGGLWHGASWLFVVWGAVHGSLLILDRHLEPVFSQAPALARRWTTFFIIVLTWVPFRARSWDMCVRWIEALFGAARPSVSPYLSANLLFLCAVCLVLVNTVPETQHIRVPRTLRWAFACSVLFFVAYLFMNRQASVFLYYQF